MSRLLFSFIFVHLTCADQQCEGDGCSVTVNTLLQNSRRADAMLDEVVDSKQFMDGLIKNIKEHATPQEFKECLALVPMVKAAINDFEMRDPDHVFKAVTEIVDVVMAQCPRMKPALDEYGHYIQNLKTLSPTELQDKLTSFMIHIGHYISEMDADLIELNQSESAGEIVKLVSLSDVSNNTTEEVMPPIDPEQFMEGLMAKIAKHATPEQIKQCLESHFPNLVRKTKEAIDDFEQKDADHIAAAFGEIVDFVLDIPTKCRRMKPVLEVYGPYFRNLKSLTLAELKATLLPYMSYIQAGIAKMEIAFMGNHSESAGEEVGEMVNALVGLVPTS